MALKKITIFLFPEGSDRTFQCRIPRFLPFCLLFLLVFSTVSLVWFFRDYRSMKEQMPHLASLAIQNERQQQQTIFLAERVSQISKKINDLKEFDRKLKIMVNLETSEENPLSQGVGGPDPATLSANKAMMQGHKELVRSLHRSLDTLDQQVLMGEREKAELHRFLESQKVLLASTPSIWPTKGWLSSRFGPRRSPFTDGKEFHKGIDISTRNNAPIVAPASALVESVGWNQGYGKTVVLNHGYGITTLYAHLEKALVKKGQYVKRGETIALVGSTGRSTGPHLHYEVHLNQVPVDPMRYILN